MSRVQAHRGGLDPQRAGEVITSRAAGTGGRGSGYLVACGLVLTVAHVLADATGVRVRFNADRPDAWSADAEAVWLDPKVDVALLRVIASSLSPPDAAPEVTPVRFGRIRRPPVGCESIGFPLFKMREDSARPRTGCSGSQYRDSHHATGTASAWSNRREGTIAITVHAPEQVTVTERSPWEGMSGAAVFSDDLLIGIIGKHHRRDGLGALAAYPVDRWYELLSTERIAELTALIGLAGTPDGLAEVTADGSRRAGGPLRQLPAVTPAFTGRDDELAQILALADAVCAGGGSGTMVISAIDGMAGIGKTALAVYAGYLLAERFPDGQLFLDLHGYTQGISPSEPSAVLAAVLQAYGVPPQQIPVDLDACAALYRNCLAGTRTLIVLDNAHTETQVRPLLPGDGGCLVLITSRRRLKALDDAYALPLDVLPMPDAIALLRQVAGRERTEAQDRLLGELAALCGQLPIALRIAAAFFRHRRSWTLEHLVARLRQSRPNLTWFSDGDRRLTTVFDLSYQTLTTDQKMLFHLLGLAPGPDLDVYAAAALPDADLPEVEGLLQDLVDHNLLAEPSPGRYRMHDLIRLYARELAGREPAGLREPATARLLDFYQHTAGRAEAGLARHTRRAPAVPVPTHAPSVDNPEAAREWLRIERANLEACLTLAVEQDQGERVVALSAGLAGLLRADGPWPRALSIHATAAATARRLDDQLGLAAALTELGAVRRLTGDFPGAVGDQQTALALCEELGDRLGQANALAELGAVRWATSDYPGATRDQAAALNLYRELGDRHGQANALTELGAVRRLTGDYLGAVRDQEMALALCEELGDRLGQANALTELGAVRWATSDYPGATRDQAAALNLYRELGDRHGQANALTQLGAVRQLIGNYSDAVRSLREALTLYLELDNQYGRANALTQLGAACRATGDHSGAIRNLREALALCRQLGYRHGQANALTELGTVCRLTGDYPGAVSNLEEALALCRDTGTHGARVWATNRYAAVFADTGDTPRALTLYRNALTHSREVQQPTDEAVALEGIAQCLLEVNDIQNGVAHLNKALEIFTRLSMQSDAERIHAHLTELNIDGNGGPVVAT